MDRRDRRAIGNQSLLSMPCSCPHDYSYAAAAASVAHSRTRPALHLDQHLRAHTALGAVCDLDRPAVQFDDFPAHGETEAGPLPGRSRGEKWVENVFEFVRRDPATGVIDLHNDSDFSDARMRERAVAGIAVWAFGIADKKPIESHCTTINRCGFNTSKRNITRNFPQVAVVPLTATIGNTFTVTKAVVEAVQPAALVAVTV